MELIIARVRPHLGTLAWVIGAAIAYAAVASGSFTSYASYTFGIAAVYTVVVLSVSLLAGWGGAWSVAHPALMAIGAYVCAFGSQEGWRMELILIVVVVVCAVVGALLGFIGSRFNILYIALLTLAFTLVVLEVVQAWSSVTGGDQGTLVMPLTTVVGTIYPGDLNASAAAVLCLGVMLGLASLVRSSAMRMRMVAAKTAPLVGRTVGISPECQMMLSFASSAAATGVAGVMLATMTGFVSPETFSLVLAINLIAAAVLGGAGSILGALVGGAFLTYAPDISQSLSIDQPFLVGGLLIIALILLPNGVVPTLAQLARAAWRKLTPARSGELQEDAVHVDTELDASTLAAPPTESGEPAKVLEISNLTVAFGGLKAVTEVTLEVRRGEVLAVIGPNGAGKTTMLNAISGLTMGGRVSGEIHLNGEPVTSVRATRRRARGIGRTFQHAELFPELSVIENVLATGRRSGARSRATAETALELVGLRSLANASPSSLPFGLQKRVDLARAMAEQPRILLLDEPFGGLDAHERSLFARRIRDLSRAGTSIVIIDHVLEDLVKVADRAVAFDYGGLIAEGLPAEVLQTPAVRESYLGIRGADSKPIPAPETEGQAVVTLEAIGHHYRGVSALTDVDLTITAGSIVGVVGANGAGKSTLGRILHGSLAPSTGRRTVEAMDSSAPRIALVPEGRGLFRSLSIADNLEVAGYASGLRGRALRNQLDEMLLWLPERLASRSSVTTAALSGGEQQLVAIARALMARPEIVILDEPALGLSPAMVEEVYGKITELVSSGVTAVLLEQLLSRALHTCSRVHVLHDGHIVESGHWTVDGFAERAERAYFGVHPSDDAPTTSGTSAPGSEHGYVGSAH